MIENVLARSRTTEVDSVATGMHTAFQSSSITTDTVLAGLMTTLNAKNNLLIEANKRLKARSELDGFDETRDHQGQ